jgi:hypothetical protein
MFLMMFLLYVEGVMDGPGFNNLTEVIMVTLMKGEGLIKEDVTKKLCFGVDGAFVFRG